MNRNTEIDVIDVEKSLLDSGSLDDYLRYKDIQQRKLFIDTDIDQFTVSEIIRHIIQFNKDDEGIDVDKRTPIRLFISSRGGEVDSGWSLVNIIESSTTPVYTINLGYQYSMAFLINLAGHKRFAMRNSKYLMHDGVIYYYNATAKVKDQMEFGKETENRIKDYVLSHSTIDSDTYDEKYRIEWYMFAEEAKQYGFVDQIIGQDCELSDII